MSNDFWHQAVCIIADNVAFKKNTSQSSTLYYASFNHPYFLWESYLAVDGHKTRRSTDDVTSLPLCSATQEEITPAWWQVNLVSTYEIQQVLIYGRATDPPGRC